MEVVKVDPFDHLNPDCLAALFCFLDPGSVKAATLVSRKWKGFLRSDAAAKCWSWARLKVNLYRKPDGYQNLLQCNLISLVPEMTFVMGQIFVDSILESIGSGVFVHLKKLDISGYLGFIAPELLTSAVLKIQDCKISRAGPNQREAIITGLRDSIDSNLKHLDLGWSWSELKLAPDVVAEALMKLETFRGSLSSPQVEAIMTVLATMQDSRLRNLHLCRDVNISSLAPSIVAQAFIKLEQVGYDLSQSLSVSQLSALITTIRQSPDLRLRQLYLYGKDLTLTPLEDLAGAIQRLEVVQFWYGEMTVDQLTTILTLAKERRLGRIKRIEILFVCGMWSVSSSLIWEAKLNNINKLEWTK